MTPPAAPTTTAQRPAGYAVRLVVRFVHMYRTMISPLRPPCCRFMPTCSQYAVSALVEHGFFRGALLSLVRLAKCGPWHGGGWDPVPERSSTAVAAHSQPRRADV